MHVTVLDKPREAGMALKRRLEEQAVPMGEAGEVGRPTLIAEFETSMYFPSSLTTDPYHKCFRAVTA